MTTIRLAFAPATTYAELARRNVEVTWREALGQPAFSALLIGALVTMAGTERVTVVDVALATVTWGVVPGLQVIAAAIVIAAASRRSVGMTRALDLFFAGHLPWSLWLLTAAAWVTAFELTFEGLLVLALTFLVPIAWTATIISAFCRTVLNATQSEARRLTALHQSVIWGTGVVSACFAIGFLQRVFAVLTP